MKKLILSWMGVLSVVLLLSSCASTTHIEKDDTINFHKYKTYAWADDKDNKTNGLLDASIRNAVNQELSKAGWREVSNRPDLLIESDVLVEKSVKDLSNPVYSQPFTRYIYNPYTRRYASIYYPSQFMGYDREQREIREGTLTITMIDAKTDKTVWQGWSTDEINSRKFTGKEVNGLVKSIFRKADLAKN